MADPVPAYLEKHSITGMLNGIVEDLVKEQPADPITFLINGLLKESTKRGQETALLQRLNELKTTLLKDQQEVKGLAAEKKDFINCGMAFQKGGAGLLEQPSDPGPGPGPLDGVDHRQGVDDIPDGAEENDADAGFGG